MTERETKTFTTPKGLVITMKTYLTGREMREWQGMFLKGVTVNTSTDKPSIEGFQADNIAEAQDKLISLMVTSIVDFANNANSPTTNILHTILDLPSDEYNAIMEELNRVSADWLKKKAT